MFLKCMFVSILSCSDLVKSKYKSIKYNIICREINILLNFIINVYSSIFILCVSNVIDVLTLILKFN